jgi:hypothetical protein
MTVHGPPLTETSRSAQYSSKCRTTALGATSPSEDVLANARMRPYSGRSQPDNLGSQDAPGRTFAMAAPRDSVGGTSRSTSLGRLHDLPARSGCPFFTGLLIRARRAFCRNLLHFWTGEITYLAQTLD